jgi:hypothetical protein
MTSALLLWGSASLFEPAGVDGTKVGCSQHATSRQNPTLKSPRGVTLNAGLVTGTPFHLELVDDTRATTMIPTQPPR